MSPGGWTSVTAPPPCAGAEFDGVPPFWLDAVTGVLPLLVFDVLLAPEPLLEQLTSNALAPIVSTMAVASRIARPRIASPSPVLACRR
jgi:hypothetical protein